MFLLGVKPIFVLEGKAPELKYNVIKQRREKSKQVSKNNERSEKGRRTRINSLQKQVSENFYNRSYVYITETRFSKNFSAKIC